MSTSSYDVLAKCTPRKADPDPPAVVIPYALVVYLDGIGTAHLPPLTKSPLTRCGRVPILQLARGTLAPRDRVCAGCARPIAPPAAVATSAR